MSNWLVILICYLVFSLINTIGNILKDETNINEDIIDVILGGIFSWILIIISVSLIFIKRKLKDIKYKSLIQDKFGNIYYCKPSKVNEIIENTDMCWTDGNRFKEYYKYWNKEMCHLKTPNVRYTPKQVWKKYPKYKIHK